MLLCLSDDTIKGMDLRTSKTGSIKP
jgi:hypothetical protein